MGAARLLARGWIVFCLYAGGHALRLALAGNMAPADAFQQIGVCAILFGAMGILFIGGYGLSAAHSTPFSQLRPTHWSPGFNELVFIVFAFLAFYMQVFLAPSHMGGVAVDALKGAMRFAVLGQRALDDKLTSCGLDNGRVLASAFSWLLAFIFLGSSFSRIRLAAGIVRFERRKRPEALGPQALALALGFASVVGIQMLYVGSAYALMSCRAEVGLFGDVLLGIGPLMLAYLIMAAITNLLALGPEA
jgi:hypothetical protein